MSSIRVVSEGEERQETPQGETIPVPSREDVMGDLRKVAKPVERPKQDESSGED